MQTLALAKLWTKTQHAFPAAQRYPPPLTASPLIPHTGCQNCLSQFFLAGGQDKDYAASGLCGTNVSVDFPMPTIILLDIWWQSHLDWYHEKENESRWELQMKTLGIFRYRQDIWLHCMSSWFTCCLSRPPNWCGKSRKQRSNFSQYSHIYSFYRFWQCFSRKKKKMMGPIITSLNTQRDWQHIDKYVLGFERAQWLHKSKRCSIYLSATMCQCWHLGNQHKTSVEASLIIEQGVITF